MSFVERRVYWGLSAAAWVGATMTMAGIAWLVYFLLSLGPKPVEQLGEPIERTGEQWRISQEIEAIEREYGQSESPRSTELAARLNHAIELQERLLQAEGGSTRTESLRLDRLLSARDTVRAEQLWPRILELEDKLSRVVDGEERLILVEELLAKRREINRSGAQARYKDLVRQTKLERESEAMKAGPLRAEVDAEHRLAKAAAMEKNWLAAHLHYSKARELMDALNREFGRTPFADIALRERLYAEEISLQGAGESAEIDEFLRGAAEAEVDRPEQAVEFYQRAVALQERLNEQWPKSRFYSTSRTQLIEAMRRKVLSAELLVRIRATDVVAIQALRDHQILAARTQITAVVAMVCDLNESLSETQEAERVYLTRKYQFLDSLGDSLRGIQDAVYAQLVPLTESPKTLLLKGEVDQRLYVELMRFNPSHAPGELSPVDSVTWTEAVEFCERLGWILGRRVCLPTAADFSAAGHFSNEFAALNDGVSEWLQAAPGILGSAVWPADGSGNVVPRAQESRSRDVGFRVLVKE